MGDNMAKNKQRKVKEEKHYLFSFDAEVSLFGMLLFLISAIGILNEGLLGRFITYFLVFLFGSFYFIPLIGSMLLGMYIFIKKKKVEVKIGLKLLSALLIVIFGLVFASKDISSTAAPSLSEAFSTYNNVFEYATVSNLKIDLDLIEYTGGGIIGYLICTLMYTILGASGTNLFCVIIILCSAMILSKPIIVGVYKFFKTIIDNIKRITTMDQTVIEDTYEVKRVDNIDLSHTVESTVITDSMIYKKPLVEPEVKAQPKTKPVNTKQEPSFNIFSFDLTKENNAAKVEFEPIKVEPVKPVIIEKEDTTFNIFQNDFEEKNEVKVEPKKETKIVEVKQPVQEVPPAPTLSSEISSGYVLPSLDLLDVNEDNNDEQRKEEANNAMQALNHKLEELNVKAQVRGYTIGPSVTQFQIVPDSGSSTKVSTIESVKNDLMLSIAATKVRMESPIPGMSAVGLEVPNKTRYSVSIREVLEPFKDNPEKLLVALGKDIFGKPIQICLNKMPHLLVAGQTGSGKSVCMNSIITSIILRTNPEEVKMILIDPKKVEMSMYANMPHLLCPVITDAKKASVALNKIVTEMDNRYNLFAATGVRNIEGYNKFALNNKQNLMPYIVVIIDELADLMMVASKDVEDSIQRITQLARAAGIHLIVATQRPSVNVITGVIKANIPSRISFAVSSQVDSRTILDSVGAEDLLGKGDMLVSVTGSELKRVQGAWVSDDEIYRVVQYIKENASTNFSDTFSNLEPPSVPSEVIESLCDDGEEEELIYQDIKRFVLETQRATTSLLQRKFSIGYVRAARMIDRLEEEGIVGPAVGAKPREVLVKQLKD